MAKGGAYERDVCKKLSKWWLSDPDTKRSIFWRTAGSGARATVRAKKGEETYGQHNDLCAQDPAGDPFIRMFSVEMKRGYDEQSILDFVDKPKKTKAGTHAYQVWMGKLIAVHKATGTPYWLFIHRRDYCKDLVFFPYAVYKRVMSMPEATPLSSEFSQFRIPIENQYITVCGMRFDDFFNWLTPKMVMRWRAEDIKEV